VKAVIQRVSSARVLIEGNESARIGPGMLILVGVEKEDTPEDAALLARKAVELRMFADEAGRMNLSVEDTRQEILAVSQFTLLADCRKGRRPSFDRAAPPEAAKVLYDQFVAELRRRGARVSTGVFQAMMNVELTNSGPVTFVLDTR
jgi:D-tyrosyl-tRNA(Tyr) deacylase